MLEFEGGAYPANSMLNWQAIDQRQAQHHAHSLCGQQHYACSRLAQGREEHSVLAVGSSFEPACLELCHQALPMNGIPQDCVTHALQPLYL